MQFGVWTIRELGTYSWCDMSNKIKRKPEMNLIAIAVDQLSVFSIKNVPLTVKKNKKKLKGV